MVNEVDRPITTLFMFLDLYKDGRLNNKNV